MGFSVSRNVGSVFVLDDGGANGNDSQTPKHEHEYGRITVAGKIEMETTFVHMHEGDEESQ